MLPVLLFVVFVRANSKMQKEKGAVPTISTYIYGTKIGYVRTNGEERARKKVDSPPQFATS